MFVASILKSFGSLTLHLPSTHMLFSNDEPLTKLFGGFCTFKHGVPSTAYSRSLAKYFWLMGRQFSSHSASSVCWQANEMWRKIRKLKNYHLTDENWVKIWFIHLSHTAPICTAAPGMIDCRTLDIAVHESLRRCLDSPVQRMERKCSRLIASIMKN